MSKTLLIITLTLLSCLPTRAQVQNPCSELASSIDKPTKENTLPQNFSPKEGGFKIGLPPKSADKPEPSDAQKVFPQPTRYKWLVLNFGKFEVSYYDTDKKLDDPSVSKTILDNFKNALMDNPKGELQVNKELTISSFPGREVKIKDDKGISIFRGYLVKSRFYIVSAFVPINLQCAVERVTKVLDSFELVNEN